MSTDSYIKQEGCNVTSKEIAEGTIIEESDFFVLFKGILDYYTVKDKNPKDTFRTSINYKSLEKAKRLFDLANENNSFHTTVVAYEAKIVQGKIELKEKKESLIVSEVEEFLNSHEGNRAKAIELAHDVLKEANAEYKKAVKKLNKALSLVRSGIYESDVYVLKNLEIHFQIKGIDCTYKIKSNLYL